MNKKNPGISVIVPVYNPGKWLRKCVDSVLAQTMPDLEVILVDDGSTDGSAQVCDEYAATDDRVRVIHQSNAGVVTTRNTGIAVSRGKWVSFVDADDMIEPHMYELLIASSADADVVKCDACFIDGRQKRRIGIKMNPDPVKALAHVINNITPGWMWNQIIKRDFLINAGILVPIDCRFSEDTVFNVQLLLKRPKIVIVNEPLYLYNRANENSTTATVKQDVWLKAEPTVAALYSLVEKNPILRDNIGGVHRRAMNYKVTLANYSGIKLARQKFKGVHKRVSIYPFGTWMNLFLWIAFNCGKMGEWLYDLYRKKKGFF